jgi:hypothetical protein
MATIFVQVSPVIAEIQKQAAPQVKAPAEPDTAE